MRWFWRVCGIEISPIKEYATSPREFTENRNAKKDKSWSGNGVDYDEVHAAIHAFDPIAARIVAAMKTYGLRLKEALCLRPHHADDVDALNITDGTKTGRPRQLKFDVFNDKRFRTVLDGFKEEVPEDCHLAWQHRNLKEAKEHMAYIARKFGITMRQRGVTWHGLRHDFAITNLEKLTGKPAPVRGGVVINYKAIAQAMLAVSQ
jgi:integrase